MLIQSDTLPPLTNVDIKESHVEVVVRPLSGGASPGGSAANSVAGLLLRYGASSEKLCKSVAGLTLQANNVMKWPKIHALMASQLIALAKTPGVHGIREVLRRILGKVMVLVT